jgi:hypothetical protein
MRLPNQRLLSLLKPNHLMLRLISIEDYSNLQASMENEEQRQKDEK